ncbi:hypothetical protein CLV88_106150 [Shimia abyssi]|uniref:Uncharacterized protein n=1 Tax=Shimia abyssi TaxID=1662395 RepID=A0A2P8FCI9_9RHOB|nr:hypothetical protein CLV88_106150 [Shimia abyssi]
MTLMPHTELLSHTAAKYQTATPHERKAEKLLRKKRLSQLANLWQVLVGQRASVRPVTTNAVSTLK